MKRNQAAAAAVSDVEDCQKKQKCHSRVYHTILNTPLYLYLYKNYKSLSSRFYPVAKIQVAQASMAPAQAATIIANTWRRFSNSGKLLRFQVKDYSPDFKDFINGKNIPYKMCYEQDQAYLESIKQADYAGIFEFDGENQDFRYSLVNLFYRQKVTWEQKATFDFMIGATQVYGPFSAYPILDFNVSDFSQESKKLLMPFMHNGFGFDGFTPDKIAIFKEKIKALPVSERFFFVFNQQSMDEAGSTPSSHSILREYTSQMANFPGVRLLNAKYLRNNPDSLHINYKHNPDGLSEINSRTHPRFLSYNGILCLSYGAENALGQVAYGEENWCKMIPRLGEQKIEDVDYFTQKSARPTISSDSYFFKLIEHKKERVHGTLAEYPEVVAHDNVHRYLISFAGKNVREAINRLIDNARQAFEIKWSKDIWIMRDLNLLDLAISRLRSKYAYHGNGYQSVESPKEYTTRLFSSCLLSQYPTEEVEKNRELRNAHVMTDQFGVPRQILLLVILDLVQNPEEWDKFDIVNHPDYFDNPHKAWLLMANYLKDKHLLSADMKSNIIKLEYFIKNYYSQEKSLDQLDSDEFISSLKQEFKGLENTLYCYNVQLDNKSFFLGFTPELKKEQEQDKAKARGKRFTLSR